MKLIKACCDLQTTFANIQFCLLSFRGKNAAHIISEGAEINDTNI